MAVMKAMHREHGHAQWILLDADADTVEVVTEAGVIDSYAADVDFVASYYVEGRAPFGPVMIRIAEATGAPVGVLFENLSRRTSGRFWQRLRRPEASQLAVVAKLLASVQAFPYIRQPTLLPDEQAYMQMFEEAYGITFSGQSKRA